MLKNRIVVLKVAIIALSLLILAQLFRLQILDHETYKTIATEKHTRELTIPASRGIIYAMDGDKKSPIVMNETVWTAYIDPSVIKDIKNTKKTIEEHIAKDKIVKNLDAGLKNKNLRYFVVAKNVSLSERDNLSKALRKEKLRGVNFTKTTRRVYPEGELAAQVLGFVNLDGVGQYGVEQFFNDELKGENGYLKTVTDVNLVPLTIGNENFEVPAEDGKDITLSIDKNIQRIAENAARNQFERDEADYSGALILDANTGKVLAMANHPTFNPEKYFEVPDISIMTNKITSHPYESGSVSKSFIYAAGFDNKVLTPDSTFTNNGFVTIDGHNIRNLLQEHFGTVNHRDAFFYSFNTGSIDVLKRLDPNGYSRDTITKKAEEILYEYYYERFKLGQRTGIELPEMAGSLKSPTALAGAGSRVTYANMTYGQGYAATMLQIGAAFGSIVNGGNYYRPTILNTGKAPKPTHRTIDEKTATTMRSILSNNRTRHRQRGEDPPGFFIGGKSGTAQIAGQDGKYRSDMSVSSYVGFLGTGTNPENAKPEYIIMTMSYKDGEQFMGAEHAGSIFTEITNNLIKHSGIRPEFE